MWSGGDDTGGHVCVVTDSTSYLPAKTVAEYGIEVVPLQVVVGGSASTEGGDVGPR
ncbi:DegV family protein, partial [Phytoactinopolyspora endophytica]|uniref:DegV family protein n=1 Tax=Phytoactinopolyspora endophytica TaxID=1642495 RepID=UPI0030B83E9C